MVDGDNEEPVLCFEEKCTVFLNTNKLFQYKVGGNKFNK